MIEKPAGSRGRSALLFLFAFLVALAYVLARDLHTGIPPRSDAASYDAFARAILEGPSWLSRDVSVRPPGYPLLLALLYALFGGALLPVQLAQALAHAGTVTLVDALGRRHFDGRTALLAALWLAVNPLHLEYVGKILREPWLTLLTVGIALALLSARRTRGLWAAAGLFTVLVHFDSRYLFHFPFFALYLALVRGSIRRALKPALAFAALVILFSVPWGIRNARVYDRLVLVDTRALDTWGKRAAGAERLPPDPLPAFEARKDSLRLSLTPVEREAYDRGLRPGRGRLAKLRFNFLEFWRLARFRPEYRPFPDARFAEPWSLAHTAAGLAFVGVLLPFFGIGAWGALRVGDPAGRLLLAWILVHTVLHTVVHGVPRYRLSIEPFYALLAFRGVLAVLLRARGGPAATGRTP